MLGAMKSALLPVAALLVLSAVLALSGCSRPRTSGLSEAATAPRRAEPAPSADPSTKPIPTEPTPPPSPR